MILHGTMVVMIIIEKRRWTGAKMALAVFILLVLLIGAGVAYTYFWGPTSTPAAIAPKSSPPPNAQLVAPKGDPKAPVGVSVQVMTSPVVPGENAMYVIKTKPKARCTVGVVYGTLVSKDTGLAPKIADEFGTLSWTWTVDKAAPVGKWDFETLCVDQKTGQSGRLIGHQEVVAKHSDDSSPSPGL